MNTSPTDPIVRSEDIYFACKPTVDLLPYLTSKCQEYYDFTLKYRFLDKWKRAYLAYYGMGQSGTDTTKLNQAGTNGEEYILKVNDFRSLLSSLLTMTTSQRPALQPKAMNTDSKSMNQTVLARTVLDYYMTEKRIEAIMKDATEFALFGAEGFVVLDWNATAGKEYGADPESGAVIYDGDLEGKAYHPIDVIRECWGENATRTWWIVRNFQNKFDLAAKYPEKREAILAVSDSSDFMKRYSNINYNSQTDADHVPVFTFYHEKTESLPNGRMTKFIGADISLSDGPLPYKKVPVYRISPANWHGTPFGYTVAYDLLGITTNLDALNSIVATNQMNYGIQNVLLPRGGEYNVYSLAQGLNGIEYDPKIGKPEPLNLLQTPKEILENIARLEKKQETLSGVNQVARGDIDRDLSGAALALIASQAVQFNNGLQQSYNFLCESVGTGIIEILQEYATTPRIASIAGKSNRARVKEFKGSDLAGINRVGVEQVNPVSKTAAGRLTMADTLVKAGLIKTVQHYLEVVMTGTLDSLYEHETTRIMLIRSENEDLSEGVKPVMMITDPHKMHILEHATVLDSPEARKDPKVAQATTEHIMEHINALKTVSPELLQLLDEQPLAPPAASGPQGGGQPPGGAPQGPPKPPGAPVPHAPPGPALAQMGNATPPVSQAAGEIKPAGLPSLPKGAPAGAGDAFTQLKTLNNAA